MTDKIDQAHAEKIRAYVKDLAEERLALEEIPEEIRDEVKLPYYVQQLETGVWLNGRDGLVISLEDLSDKLRADRSTVLATVKLDGNQLKFALDELQGDREVVSAAIWQEDKADVFREFGALPLDFFEKGYWSRRSWEEEYDPDWHDRHFRVNALAQRERCGEAIVYASDTIRSDPNAVEEAFKAYLLDKCHEDSTCEALNPLQFANDDVLGSSDFLLEAAAIVSAPKEYFSLEVFVQFIG